MVWNVVKSILLVVLIIGLPVYFFFGRGEGGEPVVTDEVKPKVYRELLYVPEQVPKIYRKASGRTLDSDLPVFYTDKVVDISRSTNGVSYSSASSGERVYSYVEPETPHYDKALGVSWQQGKGYLATAKATKYHRQSYTDNLGIGYRSGEGYFADVIAPVNYSEGGYIEDMDVYGTADEGYFETVDGDFVPNEGYLERFADLYPSEDGYLEAVYSSGHKGREGYLSTVDGTEHREDYLR